MEAKQHMDSEKHTIVITICSTKGGVGKTTLAANLGGLLSALGYKVLLVDGDIQPGLSSYYTISDKSDLGLSQLMKNQGDPRKCISRTDIANIDIVLSNETGEELQNWVSTNPAGRISLGAALKPLRSLYDFIIIDSQGANTAIQHSTVLAGDILVSPIPPDIMSSQEFQRGTLNMLEQLVPFSSLINSPIGQLYGLIYKRDNTNDAKHFAEELTKLTFSPSQSRIRILKTNIPHRAAYKKASTAHVPVHTIDKHAKQRMCELVAEILPNLEQDCMNFMEGK